MRDSDKVRLLVDNGIDVYNNILYLTGEIDEDMYEIVVCALSIFTKTRDDIKVVINTEGGDVYQSFAIYDLLKAAQNHVTAYCIGNTMSGGTIVLQAADHRVSYPNTSFMVHKGSEAVDGESDTVHVTVAYSKKISKRMLEIYKSRTKIQRIGKDKYYTAKEALDHGLIDEIVADGKV